MFKKSAAALLALTLLAACSSAKPHVIQATGGMDDIHITVGMATQVEMPDSARVSSVTVGDPALLQADQAGDVVNLVAKGGTGETNLIIRAHENGGDVKVYQYHIVVQPR